jgi:PAP2 superfamily
VTHALRRTVVRPHAGPAELAAILLLYAVYELGRGFGDATLQAAQANTARIVELEQSLGVFFEGAVQTWASGIPSLPTFLGLAYVSLHLGATGAMMVWLHRRHRERFALVRNALVIATGLSLVAYTVFPAAPPRLAGLGFVDTVTAHTHVNLSSDLLGSLYNPFAAVPSMHFGYALLVGFVLATTASNRWVRLVGALYPPFMLFDIVATGNHFVFDAAAGGLVTVVSLWAAARIERA